MYESEDEQLKGNLIPIATKKWRKEIKMINFRDFQKGNEFAEMRWVVMQQPCVYLLLVNI